jgi:hypothetical protein
MSQVTEANYARAIADGGFRLPDHGPNYSWTTSVLDAWAARQPDELALHWVSHDGGLEIKRTYADVSQRSHRAAHAFAKLGVKKGDRVMVQLPRVLDWWDVVFGIASHSFLTPKCLHELLIEYKTGLLRTLKQNAGPRRCLQLTDNVSL